MRVLVGLIPPVLALAASTPASAGTLASREVFSEGGDRYRAFTYVAGPGETNGIAVEVSDTAVTVSERDRAVTAGDGCTVVSATSAECSLTFQDARVGSIRIYAGARDDEVAARRTGAEFRYLEIHGGTGDDKLSASGGNVLVLNGQTGDDVVIGGTGSQILSGGPGHDRLSGGRDRDSLLDGNEPEATRDLLDGGPGKDGVSYSGTKAGVLVDLPARVGGRRGEADRLRGIEDAWGGGGDDHLIGTRGSNSLVGGYGMDRLIGRGGDDALSGEIAVGGAGDDDITGPPRTANCGPGRDRVSPWLADGDDGDSSSPDRSQPAHPSCEWMVGSGAEASLTVRLRDGRPRVRLRNRWPYASRVTVALYSWPMTRNWFEGGAMVARRTLVLRAGERRTVALRLTRAGRRFIDAGHRRVALVASEYEPEDTGMVVRLR